MHVFDHITTQSILLGGQHTLQRASFRLGGRKNIGLRYSSMAQQHLISLEAGAFARTAEVLFLNGFRSPAQRHQTEHTVGSYSIDNGQMLTGVYPTLKSKCSVRREGRTL